MTTEQALYIAAAFVAGVLGALAVQRLFRSGSFGAWQAAFLIALVVAFLLLITAPAVWGP